MSEIEIAVQMVSVFSQRMDHDNIMLSEETDIYANALVIVSHTLSEYRKSLAISLEVTKA